VSAGGWCTAGDAAGYALGGPAVAAAGLAAAAVVACAIVVVLWSVLFGGSDPALALRALHAPPLRSDRAAAWRLPSAGSW
jgi:hypothetical protein